MPVSPEASGPGPHASLAHCLTDPVCGCDNRSVRLLRGRERECAELSRLTASAASGAGGVVVVEGAAGIGKSRLLAEAARIAVGQGVQVAAGVADELDQVTPWAPLLRALSSTDPVVLSEDELVPLRGLVDQRLAVIECIRAALERVSRRRPLLITLDDLQWADPATLLALGLLPVQLFSYPVAWVLAQRPVPSSSQLQGMVARLDEAGAARLRLGPLDAGAAQALAADILGAQPDPRRAELVAQADGNPLYLIEVLRGAGGGTALLPGRAGQEQAPVPPSLRSVIAAHLRSLPEASRELLKVASVLGREFTVSELAAVTGSPASQLVLPLEQALLAQVIAERGDHLTFGHDLMRQAVYTNLPASLRLALHRDAAGALRREGAPLARVAAQYAAGAQPGDEQAIEVLTAAAGQLFSTSPSAAADLAVRALDLLAEPDERRTGLTVMAVGLLGWAGRIADARAVGEGYLAGHQLPPPSEAEILLGVRRAWAQSRMRPYPSPLPARVLDDPAVPAGTRSNLLALEQLERMRTGDFAGADRALATAMRFAAEGGDDLDVATVLPLWVTNDNMQGRLSDGLNRARTAFERPGPAWPSVVAAGLQDAMAQCLGGLGRTREAMTVVEQTVLAADSCGFPVVSSHGRFKRAMFLLDQGRLDDARAEAVAAVGYAEALGIDEVLNSSRALLTEVLIRQADLAAAEAVVPRGANDDSLFTEPDWALALHLDAQGKTRAALEALDRVFEQFGRGILIFATWQAGRLPRTVDLAMRAGDERRAAAAADAAATLAAVNPGVPLLAGLALQARGLLERDAGALRQAVGLVAEAEWPLAAAAAREDLGRAVARRGDRGPAIAALESAYAAFSEAGARRDAARVRSALRELGVRKRRVAVARTDHGWASLTSSELSVVEIVAGGATNKETAARLFLSPDTVNTHLRHAFAKLQIRSRVELARIAAERERIRTQIQA
jgi:DNA-binding CsgD family transcriptional regulator